MSGQADKLSILDVLSMLWKGKVTILVIALIIAVGGIAFSHFFFSDLSYINLAYQPVEEYSYKVYRGSYVSDFYASLFQLDRSLARLIDEELVMGIVSDVKDLPEGVTVSRVGNSVRVAVRSGELDTHPDLLQQGLDQYTAAVNRYRAAKAEEMVADFLERIDYDRGYRLAELEYVENYLAEGNLEYSTQALNEELTRLHVQLAQLGHATEQFTELREELPEIMEEYSLTFKNRVVYASSRPLTRFKYIIFTFAGLLVGIWTVIVSGYVRAGLAAKKQVQA